MNQTIFRFQNANEKQGLVFKLGLIQILLALIALLFMQCKSKTPENIPVLSTKIDTPGQQTFLVDSDYVHIAGFHPENVKEKLRKLEKLKFNKGSIADQVLNYLKRGENDLGEEFKFIDLIFTNRTADIRPKSGNEIADLSQIMNEFPKMKIKLLSYTDDVGDEAVNEKLSNDRAQKIVQGLTSAGISEDRIVVKAFGEKFPVADNKIHDGQLLNNRIEMMITNL